MAKLLDSKIDYVLKRIFGCVGNKDITTTIFYSF